MRKTMTMGWTAALAVTVGAGCAGRVLEVGSSDARAGDASSTGSTLSSDGDLVTPIPGAALCTWVPPADADASADASATDAGVAAGPLWTSLLGTWTGPWTGGFAVAPTQTTPPSGPLTLTLTSQADGSIAGTARFGDAAAPAPATSPTAEYAPLQANVGSQPYSMPYDGFAYTARALAFDGTTLSLEIAPGELLDSWCAVQTSYDWRSCPDCPDAAPIVPACSCLPNWAGMQLNAATDLCEETDPRTGQHHDIRCAQVDPCGIYTNTCDCSASGCVADVVRTRWRFVLTLGSGGLQGTVSAGRSVQVTLTKG